MSRETALAAVGDRASVMLFKALGVQAVYAEDAAEADSAVRALAVAGCKVIYITERLAQKIPETIEQYKTKPYPAVIPIPDRAGSTGLGMRNIRANVEKAVGADILFGEERQNDERYENRV